MNSSHPGTQGQSNITNFYELIEELSDSYQIYYDATQESNSSGKAAVQEIYLEPNQDDIAGLIADFTLTLQELQDGKMSLSEFTVQLESFIADITRFSSQLATVDQDKANRLVGVLLPFANEQLQRLQTLSPSILERSLKDALQADISFLNELEIMTMDLEAEAEVLIDQQTKSPSSTLTPRPTSAGTNAQLGMGYESNLVNQFNELNIDEVVNEFGTPAWNTRRNTIINGVRVMGLPINESKDLENELKDMQLAKSFIETSIIEAQQRSGQPDSNTNRFYQSLLETINYQLPRLNLLLQLTRAQRAADLLEQEQLELALALSREVNLANHPSLPNDESEAPASESQDEELQRALAMSLEENTAKDTSDREVNEAGVNARIIEDYHGKQNAGNLGMFGKPKNTGLTIREPNPSEAKSDAETANKESVPSFKPFKFRERKRPLPADDEKGKGNGEETDSDDDAKDTKRFRGS